MFNTKNLTEQCIRLGFSLTNENTLSRCIGDGVLQQIYCGDRENIWVGLTSMYSELPDIFWNSKVPFTTYLPKNLHRMPVLHFEVGSQKDDILLLMDGGLEVLDNITTQERLIEFALQTNSIQSKTAHLHNSRFWGAYIKCGMTDELMYEVCHDYTDCCEAFRRKKENITLVKNRQCVRFFENYLVFDKKMSKLSALWHALLLNDFGFLKQYAYENFQRNLKQAKVHKIPVLDYPGN